VQTLSYTKARQNLADIMKSANADHVPFHVTQKSGDDVVIVSKADFDALQETLYLLSSPANALRLNTSIAELESGRGFEQELIED